MKACFDLTDWSVFEWSKTLWSGWSPRDFNILYQFLWRYVHSHQVSSDLQRWQTMVHCKLRQLRQAKEDAYRKGTKSFINRPNTHWKRRQECQRGIILKTKDSVHFQQLSISVKRSERDHQLQDTPPPQHCGESTTGRRSEWALLQFWKITPHLHHNH